MEVLSGQVSDHYQIEETKLLSYMAEGRPAKSNLAFLTHISLCGPHLS